MGKNLTTKTFTQTGTFTVPGGVYSISVATTKKRPPAFGYPAVALPNIYSQITAPFFLDSYGRMLTWGGNNSGQLGNGNQVSQSSPVVVLGGLTFKAASMGSVYAMGLTPGGLLYAWGGNGAGQLGIGSVAAQSSPILVVGGLSFQSFSIGLGTNLSNAQLSSFGITTSGKLYAWGGNQSGQLGIGNVTAVSSPVAVLGGLVFAQVFQDASTLGTTYGLTTAGALYAWGYNANGQLGNGNTTYQSSPVAVLGGLVFQTVAAQDGTTLALTTSGALYGWGSNANGQLGIGNVNPQSSPVAVLGGLTFQSMALNANGFAVGLTTGGAAYAWGNNQYGALGTNNGAVAATSSPVAVAGGLTFQSLFAMGFGVTMGVTTGGTSYAWGYNATGAVGAGNVAITSSPVVVLGGLTFIAAGCAVAVMGGSFAATAVMGVTNTGQVYVWGPDSLNTGIYGNGTSGGAVSSPVLVAGSALANLQPTQLVTPVAVVPGTVMAVTMNQFNAFFGSTLVGVDNIDSMTLSYFS